MFPSGPPILRLMHPGARPTLPERGSRTREAYAQDCAEHKIALSEFKEALEAFTDYEKSLAAAYMAYLGGLTPRAIVDGSTTWDTPKTILLEALRKVYVRVSRKPVEELFKACAVPFNPPTESFLTYVTNIASDLLKVGQDEYFTSKPSLAEQNFGELVAKLQTIAENNPAYNSPQLSPKSRCYVPYVP